MKALKNLILIFVLVVLVLVMIFAGTDTKLRVTYFVFGAGVLVFLASSLMGMVTNAKKNMKGLIGGAALVLMILLFYFIVPTEDVPMSLFEKTNTGFGWSAIIGAGLYTIYALLAIFVISYVVLSIRNALK